MLLNPFNKEPYLQSVTITIRHCLWWYNLVVGKKIKYFVCQVIMVFNSSQRFWTFLFDSVCIKCW